jgi:hypothetical protein
LFLAGNAKWNIGWEMFFEVASETFLNAFGVIPINRAYIEVPYQV